jgi:hypothetical protein
MFQDKELRKFLLAGAIVAGSLGAYVTYNKSVNSQIKAVSNISVEITRKIQL